MSTELVRKEVEKTAEQIEEDRFDTSLEQETLERMKAANPAFYAILFEGKVDKKHNINDGAKCIVGEYHGLDK